MGDEEVPISDFTKVRHCVYKIRSTTRSIQCIITLTCWIFQLIEIQCLLFRFRISLICISVSVLTFRPLTNLEFIKTEASLFFLGPNGLLDW